MKSVLIYPLACALLVVAMPAPAGQEIDERRSIAGDGLVTVINVAGDIDVTTWDRDEVHLTGDLGDKSVLDIVETAQGVRIEVKREDGRRHRHDYEESDLRLVVPARASLDISGVSSDIRITGARGERLSAETVSGDVDVEAEVGRADLASVSGDVEFRGRSPRTSAESVSGDIELDGVGGELEVSLVSGDVEVSGGVITLGTFESVSGTLELTLEVAPAGRLSVESMSGDVILRLPASQSGEFTAQTFSGDIRSRFGSAQKAEHGPGRHLRHVSGDGNTSIRVESFSGDIEIGHK